MLKNKKTLSIAFLVLISLFLSACGGSFQASSWPGLSYDENSNSVYIAYNQQVFALQAENGVNIWSYPSEADNGISFFAPPVLASENALFLSGYDTQIVNIDPASNGSENWVFSAAEDRYIGSVVANDAGIFAPNADNSLYAISSDGQLMWTFKAQDALWSSPVSNGETVFQASMDHKLYALRASTGASIWEQDLGGTVVADLAIDDAGTVYAGTFEKEVLAVNGSNGRIQWRSNLDGWVWGGPTYSNEIVYVADLEGILYALDANSGREIWRVSADGAITGSPLVANEHIYVGTENGQILSVALDGRIQWTKTIEGQAYSTPVSAGELVVFGIVEGDSIVIAFDSNGNQVWSFSAQN
jgi:outer membrane protein assembly factor BamB